MSQGSNAQKSCDFQNNSRKDLKMVIPVKFTNEFSNKEVVTEKYCMYSQKTFRGVPNGISEGIFIEVSEEIFKEMTK